MQERQETWGSFLNREDSLEEEMATHSSILARRARWTEEPSGLPYVESQSQTRPSTHTCMQADLNVLYSSIFSSFSEGTCMTLMIRKERLQSGLMWQKNTETMINLKISFPYKSIYPDTWRYYLQCEFIKYSFKRSCYLPNGVGPKKWPCS